MRDIDKLSVKDNLIEIDGIDAFVDTPVLDIKPWRPAVGSGRARDR
ncbi:MAG: hypothetical protein LJE91_14100 [Gammaproteobacteria bacterium]|jgi:tRNA (Thr-GGU) A37 N-methylase|nr:hypothetical protein [Gammaproteobacteria bacterium]